MCTLFIVVFKVSLNAIDNRNVWAVPDVNVIDELMKRFYLFVFFFNWIRYGSSAVTFKTYYKKVVAEKRKQNKFK